MKLTDGESGAPVFTEARRLELKVVRFNASRGWNGIACAPERREGNAVFVDGSAVAMRLGNCAGALALRGLIPVARKLFEAQARLLLRPSLLSRIGSAKPVEAGKARPVPRAVRLEAGSGRQKCQRGARRLSGRGYGRATRAVRESHGLRGAVRRRCGLCGAGGGDEELLATNDCH
jgi:hypothetical protein